MTGPLDYQLPDSPFAIGSNLWPGLSKLSEEAGEVQQVIGKLIGTGGETQHWDGTNLQERLEDEIADVFAALEYVVQRNALDRARIAARADSKCMQFDTWHARRQAAKKAREP